jgi:hypothetical protein
MKYSASVIYTKNEVKNYSIPSEYLIHLFSRIKPNYVKCLLCTIKFTIRGVRGGTKQEKNPSKAQFMQTNEPENMKLYN